MTEPTSNLPAARPRKRLTQIAPVSWEHPADRAALQSLRSIPGFDLVVKKISGFIGERGIRLLFQADAVRVGPKQFPRLNDLYTDVLTTLDWDPRPELFVSQTPFVNAGAYGMDSPFIVINSGALKLLDDDEMRTLLGHELGHVMSGPALYHTILVLILNFSFTTLPFLAGIALLPIRIALLEWFRKSELSSDRAGLLATQDPIAAMRMYLKMAGGGDMKQMDLNAFLVQAKEYEESGGPLDRIFQILNTLDRTHPFNTLRAAELQRWIEAGHYERILNGEYTRRGPDAEKRPIDKDIDEAREHYMKEAKAVVNDVVDSAKRAAQAFSDAFKKRGTSWLSEGGDASTPWSGRCTATDPPTPSSPHPEIPAPQTSPRIFRSPLPPSTRWWPQFSNTTSTSPSSVRKRRWPPAWPTGCASSTARCSARRPPRPGSSRRKRTPRK